MSGDIESNIQKLWDEAEIAIPIGRWFPGMFVERTAVHEDEQGLYQIRVTLRCMPSGSWHRSDTGFNRIEGERP